MRTADFLDEAERYGAACWGVCGRRLIGDEYPDGDVTGWAHCEDAGPGDVAWARHRVESFRGSVLIIGKGRPFLVGDGVMAISHPSPRDLIAHLLERFEWPGAGGCPMSEVDCGTVADAQDYRWDGSRWRDIHGVGCIRVHEDVTVGVDATIVPGTLGYTTIGKGCRIGHGANLGHDARIGEYTLVLAHAVVCGWCRIGSNVKVGVNATVLNGITVGDGATIGAGAVVTHDVPPGETWVGNPARRIGADADALYGERR